MIVYKGFAPGMVSVCGKGHTKLKKGLNIEKEANCRSNGWHAAENPLDCLSYYKWNGKNEFYRCEASGDINDIDGMIACTHLTVVERMTLEQFVAAAVRFILVHPSRVPNSIVAEQVTANQGFAIAKGKHPSAVGKNGDILAFLLTGEKNRIINVALKRVGKQLRPGISYTLQEDGQIVPDGRVISCD